MNSPGLNLCNSDRIYMLKRKNQKYLMSFTNGNEIKMIREPTWEEIQNIV